MSEKINNSKTWQEKARDFWSHKSAATKSDPKAEDDYDTRLVFSDLAFTVADNPATAQAC